MALAGASGAGAQTVTPDTANHMQHFFDCFGAMLSNGSAHAQYCGPGPAVPLNLPSFFGGGGDGPACRPVGSAVLPPALGDIEVASLDPSIVTEILAKQKHTQVATRGCCISSLSTPFGGPGYDVASLDSSILAGPSASPDEMKLAGSCCVGMIEPQGLERHDVASLEDYIDSFRTAAPSSKLIATPCPV